MIHIFLCDDDSSYLEYLSEIVDRFFRQNNIEAGIKDIYRWGEASGKNRRWQISYFWMWKCRGKVELRSDGGSKRKIHMH